MELSEREYVAAPKALAALNKKLMAMPDDEAPPPGAELSLLIGNVLKVARAYAEDRALFVGTFTSAGFNPEEHDDLEMRALALWQADVDYRLVASRREQAGVIARAQPLRKALLSAALYLWEDDPELGHQVAQIRIGRGYLDMADDLLALATLFTDNWARAKGRCAVTKEDLAAARRLGQEVMRRLSMDDAGQVVEKARSLRDRALVYALRGARSVHLAALYVYRDEPERKSAYPSPLAGRRRSRSPDQGGDVAGDALPAPSKAPAATAPAA